MKKARTVKIYKSFVIVVAFLFALIIGKLCYIVLSPKVDGIDLAAFAAGRNTVSEKIVAERGTIYDSLGNVLAVDVNSYTVIAYLEESRTTDKDNPQHVVDKEMTAEKLSPIINMSKEDILNLLNIEDVYQVELGPGGRGISEIVKENIENLELPGIDFIKSVKRYYPNRDYLSNTIGYAKEYEDGRLVGELGLELEFNKDLTGTDGSLTYEGDMYGYKLANAQENIVPAENGKDIYLTIDTNIQMFTEQAMSKLKTASMDWASLSVVDAKTGAILGVSSTPSFDPNIKNITSYYDPFVSYTYEPGSTMKTFSFMSAIENGFYNPKEKYMSGSITIDNYTIRDWNGYGWGEITFDQGFYGSSNVAASILSQKQGGAVLKDFYNKLGFGKETGITLPNEEIGRISFKYDVEVANASFGQGMSVTPVQMIQAFTSITNEGTILKPYIIKKIVDSETGEVLIENERTEVTKVASKATVDKVQELMWGAVNSEEVMAASTAYKTDIVTTIGKTGTAQIASPEGGYLTGYYDYVRSFVGIFPKEKPQIIVYIVTSKITEPSLMNQSVKGLIEDISTYLGIVDKDKIQKENNYELPSYINKDTTKAFEDLNAQKINTIILGSGNKIIKQYPEKGTIINKNDKVILLTNKNDMTYVDLNGWSRKNIEAYAKLLGVNVIFNGYGYAFDFNKTGQAVVKGETLEINLKNKYIEEKTTENSS